MSEIVSIVNNGDAIIGAKARHELKPEDIYRIVGLWATNTTGNILLARRQDDKLQEPEKWDTCVAGTVLEGESYEQAMRREAHEELELTDLQLTQRTKLFIKGAPSFFCQTFTTVLATNQHPILDPTEISALQWFSPDGLRNELAQHPDEFTPGVAWALEHL